MNNPKRPVNLDLRSIKLPITAYASILHRISGVLLFFGLVIMLCTLDRSLASSAGFAEIKALFTTNFFVQLIVWVMLSALLYHLVAGIRHLLMDAGIGEALEGGVLGSKLTLVVSLVLIVLAGVWIW